ncbi:MAG TPA: nucleotidyl transferase AbiEii/AbiGii toxin family protein [Thermoanaerobaculia bacterium]|nr:nucleotidyl transferase AbiEii/AbiGii toxin family protein [Thermoanaerobaculia bacterium]
MYIVQRVLIRLVADLKALEAKWALVGGFAVAVHGEPRTTRDVDIVLALAEEAEAEAAVLGLRLRGYRDHPDGAVLERPDGRLATVRLVSPVEGESGIVVDLLFASSGLEPEIVATAKALEILPGIMVPVVGAGYLLAMKVLAGRPKDIEDIRGILEYIEPGELRLAREALEVITERGFHRGKNLQEEFAQFLASMRPAALG